MAATSAVAAASFFSISSPSSYSSLHRLSPPFLPSKNPNLLSSRYPSSRRSHRRRRLPPVVGVATPPTAPAPIPENKEQADHQTLEIRDVPEQQEEEGSSASSSSDSFSWRDHWYPVSLIEDLDPRLPTPFQLLNRDIVLWKDPKTGEWVAFDDRCPHRLAPLSVLLFTLWPAIFFPFSHFYLLSSAGHMLSSILFDYFLLFLIWWKFNS